MRFGRGRALAGLTAVLWLVWSLWSPVIATETSEPSVLEVFVREGCPHCDAAKAFLPELQAAHPDLRIQLHWVDRDPAARERLLALAQSASLWPPGVPLFAYQGRVQLGFADAARSGPELQAFIDGTPAARPPPEETRPVVERLEIQTLGLPLFTITLGLLDGFNPCAMWVLLFLLSLLVHLRDRQRMALIAGTFVAVSGLIYYAFLAAWLNVFLAIGLTPAMRAGLAVLALVVGLIHVKDFLVGPRGISLSIPATAKPGLYARMRRIVQAHSLMVALPAAAALAVIVNTVELLCTAGLPALYTAVLAQQGLSTAAYHAYLALYIVGYLADDALMVTLAVVALGSHRLNESAGRWLKLLSGLVMLGLGLVLWWEPGWLS